MTQPQPPKQEVTPSGIPVNEKEILETILSDLERDRGITTHNIIVQNTVYGIIKPLEKSTLDEQDGKKIEDMHVIGKSIGLRVIQLDPANLAIELYGNRKKYFLYQMLLLPNELEDLERVVRVLSGLLRKT